MVPFYIVCAIVGGGLVLLSALGGVFGHGDVDSGGDLGGGAGGHPVPADSHHGDAGHAMASSGALWLPFATIRFWTYFFAGFGLLGLVLTSISASAEPLTALIAGLGGLAAGLTASWLFRILNAPDSNSNIVENDFLGADGRITVAARGTQPGKVRACIKGDWIDMLAVSEFGDDLEPGEEVLVVGIENGRLRVARPSEYLGQQTK